MMKLLPGLFGLCLATLASAATRQPNIVHIFCDDYAYQAISAYGDERKLLATPNIDQLAASGLRYNNFHTTAICSSMAR